MKKILINWQYKVAILFFLFFIMTPLSYSKDNLAGSVGELRECLEKMEEGFRKNNWKGAENELNEFKKGLNEIRPELMKKWEIKELEKLDLLVGSLGMAISKESKVMAENRFRSVSFAFVELLKKFPEVETSWIEFSCRYIDQSLEYLAAKKYYDSQQELGEILELLEKNEMAADKKEKGNIRPLAEEAIKLLTEKEYDKAKSIMIKLKESLNQLRTTNRHGV
ncbi:MAG: hypothetical protein A2504_14605 [Bdellovibrionales bacterium RIFOXYD12_FULL_39_22]|nr:MAG: hypothetical protein A2385_15085 [Bdellovibrionales bacterium RIFOXYB1_FULL_39_21]OFZ40543.1 MAG: hypothetical protein A2485_13585 [Bdellovibrionales bacterium RIFOXYC12_FULL_39_17]OFZ49541.1 MAG: hypothetical protein A2404_07820 [Bdellovibrionales bacterium RIFOXYC1_FULL_39_130]OFZ71960.1 MAG: hypothetical protein A2451_05470 [Bdellovibrionales bacterium RIFOXYC2_FULL_39_8]OFZ77145.1 MAG: hypothetical protein A2560_17850 [Bdellovibrionales bacterium RIFOXYD1_FULL_39_84]OFZ91421.1 MAG: